MSQAVRLKNIEQTRNYFIKEINQNEWISKKHQKVCIDLDFIEQLFIYLSCAVNGCVWTSAVPSLFAILIRITTSAVALKKTAIAPRTKYCKPVSQKKKIIR